MGETRPKSGKGNHSVHNLRPDGERSRRGRRRGHQRNLRRDDGAAATRARARGHRGRAADGRARRDHRQRRIAPHPGRAALLRREPGVGRQRLCARVRRPAAARRADGRPARTAPDLHRRHRPVRGRLAGGRVRPGPGVAAHRPGRPGHRRRAGRARLAVADRRHLPRGQGAEPGDGRVRGRVDLRRGHRADRRRAADQLPRLALGVLRERAHRPGSRAARAPGHRRVRADPRQVRPARRDHRLARPGRPGVRAVGGGDHVRQRPGDRALGQHQGHHLAGGVGGAAR